MKLAVSVCVFPSESTTWTGVEKVEVLSAFADEFRLILN